MKTHFFNKIRIAATCSNWSTRSYVFYWNLAKNSSHSVEISALQLNRRIWLLVKNKHHVHRGVVVYVKRCLNATERTLNDTVSFCESVWCEWKLKGEDKLLIEEIYRSPNSTKESDEQLNHSLQYVKTRCSHHLIMGDFNHPEIHWYQKRSPPNPNHTSTIFMEAVRDAFLHQHVLEVTHYRGNQQANTLDLIFTTEEKIIQHLLIGTTRKITSHPFEIYFQMLQA